MKRSSKQGRNQRRSDCPISFALGIFGDRWTLLVLRDLMLRNKRRFKELAAAPERIATNVLSDRLRRLADAGLITREPDPEDRRQGIYRATERGIDLVPMLVELVVWGARNDPGTGVTRDFIERFERNRQGLIRAIQHHAAADVS